MVEMTIIKSIQTSLPNLKLTRNRIPFACEFPRRRTVINDGVLVYADTFKPLKSCVSSLLGPQSILVLDSNTMHEEFKKVCGKLPNRPGNLIVFGHRKNDKIIIDLVRSAYELRRDFKAKKNTLSRWDWCLQQLLENGFSSLSFELAEER